MKINKETIDPNLCISGDTNLPTTWTEPFIPDATLSYWDYWNNYYYPQVYPIYIKEQTKEQTDDKGKKAYEIIKTLRDKKLIEVKTVDNFIDLMDCIMKIL